MASTDVGIGGGGGGGGGGDEKFCKEYLVLKPEEGGYRNLFHLLYSPNVEHSKFVDSPAGTEIHGIKRRWLLVVSVTLQKILLSLGKPMFWIGLVIETFLNTKIVEFFVNLFQGKMPLPDKNSATFTSFIGHLDSRVDLDKKIEVGSSRYHGALSAMAAKLSYENEASVKTVVNDHWKMKFLKFYDFWNDYQGKATTQAFMFQDKEEDPELVVMAFRGTEPFDADAWITDLDISWYDLSCLGKVHGGFMKALGLVKGEGWPQKFNRTGSDQRLLAYYTLRDELREILGKNENAKVIVTGHSLGGALAILFPAVLAFHKEDDWMLKRFEGVYTFGQPRVGDEKLGEYMKEQLRINDIKYFRYVYCNDMVPRVPYDDKSLLFKHFGTCLYFNSRYEGKVVDEEPNKNYFNIFRAIPKMLNAVYELFRSFFIGYWRGTEYSEGWFLILFRVVGVMIPGLSAHCPRDYVNITRIGSLTQPLHLQDLAGESLKLD
ncbi:uncharacterized protein LOC113346659 [Papaver somniferum]|nr:uncharacterized protein LOC113346659 [Papaver somniferum]